ncbi:ribonuclease inhibitor-like [Labeo rohita]|uniref:ribonuclease inhibitor-like n=1 Tax=Labeo rohita TaxID=84645 RepID=UPI0021E2A849|nr:ribonuclease inhibitor-like [Labeo rohita]
MNTQFKLEKLDLYGYSITEKQCLILTSALKSNPSHLRELNLSVNNLGDSGVKNLSDLLMNTQFKLEKLELVSLYCTAVTVRLKFTVYFHKVTMKLKLTVIIFMEYCID